MASITVVSTTANDRLSSSSHATSSIITSSPNSSSNSPTTYLLLTTTSSEAKPVGTKSTIAPKRSGHHLSASSNSQSLRAKRKIQFTTGGERHPAPPAVARRNERERNRVRQVNLGFATLRQHVPNGTKSKKMSKVETLRSAVQYIKQLQQLLNETGHSDNGDENSAPSFEDAAQLSLGHLHRQHQHQMYHQNNQIDENLGLVGVTSPYSAASSPTPSLGSEADSPYGDSLSPEDEDLLDWCLNIW